MLVCHNPYERWSKNKFTNFTIEDQFLRHCFCSIIDIFFFMIQHFRIITTLRVKKYPNQFYKYIDNYWHILRNVCLADCTRQIWIWQKLLTESEFVYMLIMPFSVLLWRIKYISNIPKSWCEKISFSKVGSRINKSTRKISLIQWTFSNQLLA